MRRAFISLYGLIVISVIAVGWGLDRLWNAYLPDDTQASGHQLLINVLQIVANERLDDHDQVFTRLADELNLDVTIVPVNAFAQSTVLDQMLSGGVVEVQAEDANRTLYQLMPDKKTVMRLRIRDLPSGNPFIYDLLLAIFYSSLAIVVFLWVWPLSRDLNKLEKQTRILGREDVPERLFIGPTSAVYDLAEAFRSMSRRIQELLASHREMTYAVSHELRTPLARMKFALEMAVNSSDVKKIHVKLIGVKEDVAEMDALVNQLLAYAGFEQGEQSLNFQSGDMGSMLLQLAERVKSSYPNSTPHFQVRDQIGRDVRCEWVLMERAVLNLLHNAQRFATSQVLVTLCRSGSELSIQVEDDGPGIPAEDRLRVLNSFVRLTNPVNSKSRGFGLGLAIVQRVMTWHRGRVDIAESTLGGAKVSLVWPDTNDVEPSPASLVLGATPKK